MNWRVEFAPAVERDVAEAADWYESRQPGLGVEYVEEIILVAAEVTRLISLGFQNEPPCIGYYESDGGMGK
jgi:hypothetical protein